MTTLRRIGDRLKSVGVRTKIIGIILGLTVVLGASVTLLVRVTLEEQLVAELHQRGTSIASDLSARVVDDVLFDDRLAISDTFADTSASYEDVIFVFLVGPSGTVVADTLGGGGLPVQVADSLEDLLDGGTEADTVDTPWGTVHTFAAPVRDGSLGTVVVGLGQERVDATIGRMTNQLIGVTLLVGLLGELAAGFLTWFLTRPIDELIETTERVREGDLTVRTSPWADDEIGALARSFNDMVESLEKGRVDLAEFEASRQRLLRQLLTVQEEERRQISRRLHDSVGQSLGSLIVNATLLERSASPEHRERLTEMKRVATETLQQVRELSHELRPSVLDDLGLDAAIRRYAEDLQQVHGGVGVDVHVDLGERLPAEIETTLYRVVQEAMTNAARHSGARSVSVLVAQRNRGVQAIVEDDGSGFEHDELGLGDGVGIHGMRERAELVGGSFELETSGSGTTVYVEVPL